MKKRYFVLFTVFVFLCTAICISLTACNNKDYPVFSNDQINGNLLADNYKDYANEVYLDYENNPELETQGLFWTKWDDVNKKIVYVKADTAEGAALVDPSKPTIINAHGIKIRESSARDSYEVKLDIAKGSDFGYDTEKVNTLRIWLDQGYNVAVFSWEKFADDGIMQIETKVWAKGGTYKTSSGGQSEYKIDFSISELFVAEYIRAVNLLPSDFGKEEIRFAGHSMGGVLVTSSMFLLTELVSEKQIKYSQIPKRLTYLDSYLGGTPGLSPTDFVISWSGKNSINSNSADTFVECFNELKRRGMAMEFYRADNSFVDGSLIVNRVLTSCVVQTILINYPGYGSNSINAHPVIRDWYMCSILFDPPVDASSTSVEGAKAASASCSIDEINQLAGVAFMYSKGTETLKSSDDTYVRITSGGVI